jgi:hypothetical protein
VVKGFVDFTKEKTMEYARLGATGSPTALFAHSKFKGSEINVVTSDGL